MSRKRALKDDKHNILQLVECVWWGPRSGLTRYSGTNSSDPLRLNMALASFQFKMGCLKSLLLTIHLNMMVAR